MAPANIINGFKTCGVYPLNPKAVLDHDPCEPKISEPNALQSNDASQCHSSEVSSLTQCESNTADNSSCGVTDKFTPEEEARFVI